MAGLHYMAIISDLIHVINVINEPSFTITSTSLTKSHSSQYFSSKDCTQNNILTDQSFKTTISSLFSFPGAATWKPPDQYEARWSLSLRWRRPLGMLGTIEGRLYLLSCREQRNYRPLLCHRALSFGDHHYDSQLIPNAKYRNKV